MAGPPQRALDRPLLRAGSAVIGRSQFLARADMLANRLPAGPAALNLCERRDNFLVAFLALLIRGQICLLPPSRAPAVIAEVAEEHPGCHRIDDSIVASCQEAGFSGARQLPEIPPDRVVVIGYTSGSTGRPKANPKTWGSFAASTALNAAALRMALSGPDVGAQPWILATVPPQHMYGLEMSVLMPLLGGMGIHEGHPLYPADIASALEQLPEPRILVTTPVHLRALVQSAVPLPALGAIVSATAPLAAELAETVEQRFGTVLLEFFGSTETCVIASRRPARESTWQLYPGVKLHPADAGTRVVAPWFTSSVLLQDVLEVRDDDRFVVRGRSADLIEVGGKRASLSDLTRRLLSIPGVADAVVFQLEPVEGVAVQRLAALAVAEGLTEAEILARLAPAVDPVFLPRPLVLLPRLPRNEVGKLPRDRLLAALRR